MPDSEEPVMPDETPPHDEQDLMPRNEKVHIGKVGLVLSLVGPTAMLLVSVRPLSDEGVEMVVWPIVLLTLPIALLTNIVALRQDKSKVLGTIGLLISVVCTWMWGPTLLVAILWWMNGPILP